MLNIIVFLCGYSERMRPILEEHKVLMGNRYLGIGPIGRMYQRVRLMLETPLTSNSERSTRRPASCSRQPRTLLKLWAWPSLIGGTMR